MATISHLTASHPPMTGPSQGMLGGTLMAPPPLALQSPHPQQQQQYRPQSHVMPSGNYQQAHGGIQLTGSGMPPHFTGASPQAQQFASLQRSMQPSGLGTGLGAGLGQPITLGSPAGAYPTTTPLPHGGSPYTNGISHYANANRMAATSPGMHPGMQPGMQPGMHTSMHPGMQQGMQQGMHQGMTTQNPRGFSTGPQADFGTYKPPPPAEFKPAGTPISGGMIPTYDQTNVPTFEAPLVVHPSLDGADGQQQQQARGVEGAVVRGRGGGSVSSSSIGASTAKKAKLSKQPKKAQKSGWCC